jgi:hypothetical protein
MQRDNDTPGRVVKQNGTHADCIGKLECLRRTEEGLVLPNGVALIVEDRPATADPAWAYCWSACNEWTGFGLDLLLDLAAKAV